MTPVLRRNAPVFWSLAGMFALYIPWMNRGNVNLEYVFPIAGRALAFSKNAYLLDAYWGVQANPLGYPLSVAALYRIFGFHDWFWLARVPSLLGGAMLIVAGWMLSRDRWLARRSSFFVWSAMIIFHPMVIAFATAATADVLPIGLAMMAIAFAVRSRRDTWLTQVISAVFFGISIVVKYNSAYLGLAFVATAFIFSTGFEKRFNFIARDLAIYTVIPGVILGAYIWWSNSRFNVLISNRLDAHSPNFLDIGTWMMTFGKYIAFLGLFCGLIPIAVALSGREKLSSRGLFLGLSTVAIVIGWFVIAPFSSGELDFGGGFPLGNWAMQILQTFGFVSGISLCVVLVRQFRSSDQFHKVLLWGLGPYLILISASRPTQRYLIFAIPIVMLLLVDASNSLSRRVRSVTFGCTALGFAAVSLFGMSYLRAEGNASERMAVWMEQNGLIDQSSAGAIGPHAGQHFLGITKTQIIYEVVAISPANESLETQPILHREPMNVLGRVSRVYILREIATSP